MFLVGFYYFQKSKNLRGGDIELQFLKEKNLDSENKIFNCTLERKIINVEEDDIVVFLNRKCNHRVTEMSLIDSEPDKIYERKILVFCLFSKK